MFRVLRHVLAAMAICLAGGWLVSPAAAADTLFSGRATVIDGKVAGIPITLVDTKDVSPQGGDLEANLLCYPTGTNCTIGGLPDLTNGMLQAEVLHAAVVAHGNKSSAEASVASFALNVAGQSIGAEFLRAEAEARCTNGAASVRGSAEVVALVVNGTPITVTGEVGQRVPLPGGGVVILNEQTSSAAGNSGNITVSVLHIQIPAVTDPVTGQVTIPATDLVVARAHADIVCASPPSCSGPDKVTGGGFVGGKNNFAVAGRQLSSWGHFLFQNKATGDRMKATTIDPMTFDAAGFAVIKGVAEVNGAGAYPFTVRVKDNGEPGRNDQFELTSTHPAMQQPLTTISGGNIQFHKPCK